MPFAVLIVCTMLSYGCSVVGLGVGAIIDSKTPEYTRIEKNQMLSLEHAEKITLYLEDGSCDYGKITSFTTPTLEEMSGLEVDSGTTIGQRMLIFESTVYPDTASQVQYIPMWSVSYAQARNTKRAKYVGLAIGLLFDIMALSSVHINPILFQDTAE